MAKVVICLGLEGQIKSNPGSTVQEKEDRETEEDLPSSALHSWAADIHLLPHCTVGSMDGKCQLSDQPAGSMWWSMGGREVERLEHSEESWNWRLEGGEESPVVSGQPHHLGPWWVCGYAVHGSCYH